MAEVPNWGQPGETSGGRNHAVPPRAPGLLGWPRCLSCPMAVLNRCAIAVAPKPPMREWTRPFWTREDKKRMGDE